jgi:hypothetical protein
MRPTASNADKQACNRGLDKEIHDSRPLCNHDAACHTIDAGISPRRIFKPARIAMTDPLPNKVASPLESEETLFQWNARIRMLFNPVLWRSFLFVFCIPILLLSAVLGVLSGSVEDAWLLALGGLIFFVALWILIAIVVDLMGGFQAKYLITNEGIYFKSGKAEKAVANTAVVVGALARSAGSGLLARSEQSSFLDWKRVKKVKIRPSLRYIEVRGGFGSKPIGLYCTEENFPKVLETVRAKRPGASLS